MSALVLLNLLNKSRKKDKMWGLPSILSLFHSTGPGSAVCNVSGNRCESDCRSRGSEFDLGSVPYFRGDWSWNNFYGHSPPFCWIIQGLLSVTSESMCTKYWLIACPGKSVVRRTDRPAMTIAVDLGRKATKQTKNLFHNEFNEFNNTRAWMLDSIYHMTLRLLWNLISAVKSCYGRYNISWKSVNHLWFINFIAWH